MSKILAALCLAFLCGIGCGCTSFSGADLQVIDHRSAVMDGQADRQNALTVAQWQDPNAVLQSLYVFECERRAARNLSDTGHWRKPTYKYPPKYPTTLPWKPLDDVPASP